MSVLSARASCDGGKTFHVSEWRAKSLHWRALFPRYIDIYADIFLCSKLEDNDGTSSEEEADEEDVAAALKKEVAQLQASGTKQERRFQALQSGANNVIFIQTHKLGTCFNHVDHWSGVFWPACLPQLMCFSLAPRIRQAGSSHPVWSPHH